MSRLNRWVRPAALALAAAAALSPWAARAQAPAADTLAAVRARGQLVCGVSTGVLGLSLADSQGVWRGLDVDFCRAVAAAVLGDGEKVRFVPTTTQTRFTALQSGEVDVLSRGTTWTFGRDAGIGLAFTGVTLHDGQGFLIRKSLNVSSAKELDGATICLQPGSTSELNITDWARVNNIRFQPVVIENFSEVQNAFFSGRCDVYSSDLSGLAGVRASRGPQAADYALMPETISREPLGPLVRQGDFRWFSIVKWVGNALVAAEELGVTQANADSRRQDANPEVQRLLGTTGEFGKQLGLDNAWAFNAVRAVGNYGEVWKRHYEPLGVARGQNRLARDGGLMWSPPFR
ncbi:amino acid ABC transporter substrate-binding protein [Roseomonas sp. OT10]|uniref:amino acid ABC transporter substrate-binding protein n=1 Tax=Roseomonas cutis TaxID=2897332 RepID=UPI001E64847D|nr:amino acid ABC transporter substrate-binding protein [Roseomonas sp. OT10]UFN50740.1 amino acid ABC transporter substrate-binding protein [Roseomonas sp. OT10]